MGVRQAAKTVDTLMYSSDLSDPPSIKSDEEYKDIAARFSTPPISFQPSEGPTVEEGIAADDSKAVLPEDDKSTSPSRPKRSTRNVRPVHFPPNDDDLIAEVGEPSDTNKRVPAKRGSTNGAPDEAAKKPPAKRARPNPRTSGKKSKWDPKYVTESERSPLVNVDLRSLLLQPAAWDCLTAEDKQEILSLMPDQTHIEDADTPGAHPNFQSLRNDDNFRHDCDEYVSNLSNGMHDPTWLKEAWIAHGRRNAGQFDQFHIRKLELEWSATIPDEHKPQHLQPQKNGESSTSTGQPSGDQAVSDQPKPEKSTSQAITVNSDVNQDAVKTRGKKKGKGKVKGASAPSRSGKSTKVEDIMAVDGASDCIQVAEDSIDVASAVVGKGNPKPPTAADVMDVQEDSCIHVNGSHIGHHHGRKKGLTKPKGGDSRSSSPKEEGEISE